MKLDILCSDGSPLGITSKDLWGDGKRGIGVGGSEYALLTLCQEWDKIGHKVTLYNNPLEQNASPFEQRNINEFDPNAARDVLIVFRSPTPRAMAAKGLKVWWSCDQFTLGDFHSFSHYMDRIVLISPFHQKYFERTYKINNVVVIDLPIRIADFPIVEKVSGKCIFTSVPDRGLQHLHAMWPIIKRDNPEATLTITSDYRLWGSSSPGNIQHKTLWMSHPGVKFVGALRRAEYLNELASAQLLLYPSMYDTAELFCISVAEAQYAGVYPITSTWGALETTNMGAKIPGKASEVSFRDTFIGETTALLQNPETLKVRQFEVSERAFNRFNPDIIIKQWDEKVFK